MLANERDTIMDRARSRRRRAEIRSAGKTSRRLKDPAAAPVTSLTGQVLDLAQDAAAQVGTLVKAAARTITEAVTDVEPAPQPKTQ